MNEDTKYGEYIKEKRKANGWSLRTMALKVGVKFQYITDIEKGNRPAPPKEKLLLIAKIFDIDKSNSELKKYLDMAAETRDTIPIDVEEFIRDNVSVISFLRKIIYRQYIEEKDFEDLLKSIKHKDIE